MPFPCTFCAQSFVSEDARNGHVGTAHVRVYERKEIEHGTTKGYRAHKRRTERACGPCLQAWRTRKTRK